VGQHGGHTGGGSARLSGHMTEQDATADGFTDGEPSSLPAGSPLARGKTSDA